MLPHEYLAPMSERPDPAAEIRMTTLHATRGANFWSFRPVTRMDLTVGAFDEISSTDVPGVTDALVAAMPGLREHRCSIGERGGFVLRLRRGTYAPHIIEHVALELQSMIGHQVGYGRARGGDVAGEYTVVFEHRHEGVGMRAAALALEVVQRAYASQLDPEHVEHATRELTSLAQTPDVPSPHGRVCCGISGGAGRAETRDEMVRRGVDAEQLIIDVAPSYLLQAGLPYSRSDIAIVLDSDLHDVPGRYQERERAQRLVGIVIDGVRRGGYAIIPAKEWEIQDYAREEGCRVAIFATDDDVTRRDKKVARAVALVSDNRILIDHDDEITDAGVLRPADSAAPQVAGALAAITLQKLGALESSRLATSQ